jgi:hypothetical protein
MTEIIPEFGYTMFIGIMIDEKMIGDIKRRSDE